MPTPGLSLVGFMDQLQAIRYMQANCVMPNPADIAALISEWTAASANLGQPFADAGHPDIQPIPSTAAAQTYIQQLQQQPWVQESLKAYPTGTLQVVEIDPLLAFQFHISLNHSDGRCAADAAAGEHKTFRPRTVIAHCIGLIERSNSSSRTV
jgi:hypothetical protein